MPYHQQEQARVVNVDAPHRSEGLTPLAPARHQEGLCFAATTAAQRQLTNCKFDGTELYQRYCHKQVEFWWNQQATLDFVMGRLMETFKTVFTAGQSMMKLFAQKKDTIRSWAEPISVPGCGQ
ncbi:unnamed protein product [Peronospora belbahrii]|uniref:Uncharacterized protein n=1 Tax=Peronospora belbahrii TaxID=622444 RepID=A0AAU9KSE4_9STRA|nr:unnamed protein product [Peronospora belbahrii]